jgi:hyperosmotically inducible protein
MQIIVLVVLAAMTPVVSGCIRGGNAAVNQSIDDATISTRVKTALLNEPGITPTKIDVDTSQGIVTLTGSVKSKEEEQMVIATVRKVSGVRDVKSALQILPQ